MKQIVDFYGTLGKTETGEWLYKWNKQWDMANIRLDGRNTEEQAYQKIYEKINAKYGKKQ